MNDNLLSYNPYDEIDLDDKYYEDKFIKYLELFKRDDKEFIDVIIKKNDEEIDKLLDEYLNEKINIYELYRKIRLVKNIILISEPGEICLRHLKKIDKLVDQVLDKRNMLDDRKSRDLDKIDEIFNKYQVNSDNFLEVTVDLKKQIDEINEIIYHEYSKKEARKMIKYNLKRLDRVILLNAIRLNLIKKEIADINLLVDKYKDRKVHSYQEYLSLVSDIKLSFNNKRDYFREKYSTKIYNMLNKILLEKSQELIDKWNDYYELEITKLINIFNEYEEDIKNILKECQEVRYFNVLTDDEKFSIKRELYENKYRLFKNKIRKFNKELRDNYSYGFSSKKINKINLSADRFNKKLAKSIDMPIPKNPWIVRKYLYADIENFTSDRGNKIRKIINKPLKFIVKLAVNNKIVIEESPRLNPDKPYIFVSTHYFTEDVIGLFVSLDRQAHMLMGTTDQIENNPLMIAAVLFGFFHVDRMDDDDRKLCFEKQNVLIDKGVSFINYIGGSWENSENELQPLSFSGPYRTSKLKSALIVPVSSCLVREDKKIYMRFGEAMDLTSYSEEEANEIIRDTLASMHYKQIEKYTHPIKDSKVVDKTCEYLTHDLPYDQHTYYMNQVGDEYWHQPWTKPFAKEEIGLRRKKVLEEGEVYEFIDNLSRDKLIELSKMLSDIMVRTDESRRYNIIEYLDSNYEFFKERAKKRKLKR